jgi:hypothetical protein
MMTSALPSARWLLVAAPARGGKPRSQAFGGYSKTSNYSTMFCDISSATSFLFDMKNP